MGKPAPRRTSKPAALAAPYAPPPAPPRVGDTVVIRGVRSPMMVVQRVGDVEYANCECIWFSDTHVLQRAWIKNNLLVVTGEESA